MLPPYYVPVLRWKRAEQRALGAIMVPERDYITPLVELVPRDYEAKKSGVVPTIPQVADKQATAIARNWHDRPMYVDCGLLPPRLRRDSRNHPLGHLARLATEGGLKLIPVADLRMTPAEVIVLADAATLLGQGSAIRLKPADLWDRTLGERVEALVGGLRHGTLSVDVLIDYEITDSGAPAIASVVKRLGGRGHWRTVAAISGAFPKDLTGFSPGEHLHPRGDLTWWRSQAPGGQPPCAFGDYAIQHPIFSEPPGRANFSASIRYATEEHWVVMRGEGVFNDDGPGFAQWPANAQLLCDRTEFCGSQFSDGDRYISAMGQQAETTGNAETWLRAGLNHHMVYTSRQIAKLFGI